MAMIQRLLCLVDKIVNLLLNVLFKIMIISEILVWLNRLWFNKDYKWILRKQVRIRR